MGIGAWAYQMWTEREAMTNTLGPCIGRDAHCFCIEIEVDEARWLECCRCAWRVDPEEL